MLKEIQIPIEDLLLDPNNPRFISNLEQPAKVPDEEIEKYNTFNEKINYDQKIENCRIERMKEKEKATFCKECREYDLCEGVWKVYSKVYGYHEISPLKRKG